MTEKRFRLVKCYNEQWGVVDNSLEEIDQLVLITTSKSGTGYLVNELNKLFDENEQLKQDKKRLIGYLHRYGKVDVEDIDDIILNKEYFDEWGDLYD